MKRIVGLALVAGCLMFLTASSAHAQDMTGRGGVGGSAGVMKYAAGSDWTEGSMRFSGQVVFKYHIDNAYGVTLEFGGGWNNQGGTGPSDTLAVVFPFTVGGFYRFQAGDSSFWPNIGAGLGIYGLGIKDGPNTWAKEEGPGTQNTGEQMLWRKPGFFVRGGGEFMFSESFSCNVDAAFHYIAASDDRFTRFGNSSTGFVQGRVGLNYYFGVGGGGDSEAAPADDGGE